MEFHNTVEDTVIARVNEIFDTLDNKGNPGKFCTCQQCRMDIICYALNRMPPHYIVSNRGAARVQWESIERQQQAADITAMVHEGLKQVNHNQRPHYDASTEKGAANPADVLRILQPHHIARVVTVKKIPMDKRHGAKIDYERLEKNLR